MVYVTVGPHEVPLDHTPTAHTPHRPIEHLGEHGTQKPHEDTSRKATQPSTTVTKEVKSHINDSTDSIKVIKQILFHGTCLLALIPQPTMNLAHKIILWPTHSSAQIP